MLVRSYLYILVLRYVSPAGGVVFRHGRSESTIVSVLPIVPCRDPASLKLARRGSPPELQFNW